MVNDSYQIPKKQAHRLTAQVLMSNGRIWLKRGPGPKLRAPEVTVDAPGLGLHQPGAGHRGFTFKTPNETLGFFSLNDVFHVDECILKALLKEL